MQQKNLDPFQLAKHFLTALQAVAVPEDTASGPRHFSFMRNKVTIALNDEEAKVYRHLVDRLYANLGPERRECVSRKTIEEMLQTAITAVVPPNPDGRTSPESALEALRRGLRTRPTEWDVWCGVVDLAPPRRQRRFGRVSFQAATPATLRAVVRQGRKMISTSKHSAKDKRVLRSLVGTQINEGLTEKVIARITVQAVDQESAQRLATQHIRATLDVISFFGTLLWPTALTRLPSLDGGVEHSENPALLIQKEKRTAWPSLRPRGQAIQVDDLFEKPVNTDLGVSILSKLLRKDHPTESEQRIMTAARWAGRAASKVRPSEVFLFYLIALECLLLPPKKESELNYRMRLRGAHLLARKSAKRAEIFKRIGELYSTRSGIVHNGSQDVSDDDLSSARIVTLKSVLIALKQLGREPDLEAWFVKQALK